MMEQSTDHKSQDSEHGCFHMPRIEEKPKNTDEQKERIGNLLHRSFLEGKSEAREVLEKKKRRENEERQENRIKRIPNPSFIFEKKPNFTEVFYKHIPDNNWGKELLLHDLPIQWTMPEPEAVISITGIEHQFNIKDNSKLKRDLIEAVISTESWIVTCGTESGTVQFIEEAVNAHIAIKNCHIPIVGILPQQIYKEKRKENKHHEVISIERRKKDNWVEIPCISMPEELDPIHTQFIFTKNGKRNKNGKEATCREAFEHFLLNINIKERELNTHEILPIVLVLIEGGIHALRTAKSVLNQGHHVVVIDGSGGVADFLAACYDHDTRDRNGEIQDTTIAEVTEEHFEGEDDSLQKEVTELSEWFMKTDNKEKIHVYSAEKTDGVDEIIQNAMFEINKEYHKQKIIETKQINALKTNAIREQLKLVEKWQRCDLATKDIFLAKNRKYLSSLQTINTKRMSVLQNKIRNVMDRVKKNYESIKRELPAFLKRFKEETSSPLTEVSKTQYFWVLSTSFYELAKHMPVDYFEKPDTKEQVKKITNTIELIDETRDKEGMKELRMEIEGMIEQVKKKYQVISKELIDSCEEFQKAVLQFKEVNKKKARYFSVLSDNFKDMIKYMTVDAVKNHKQELREIVKEIVDEYKKDMVSQLLLTSIISNRKDLVELTIGKIENIEAFVFDKLANIYWRCIKESPEDLPIKLIEQVSNIEKFEKEEEKTENTNQIKRENDKNEIEIDIETEKDRRKRRTSNKILFAIDDFIRDLFGDTKFNLYTKHTKETSDTNRQNTNGVSKTTNGTSQRNDEESKEIEIEYMDKPFYHLFVLAVLANWKEMAMTFWERDTDHTCSALFASAVLNEMANRAHFSNLMDLTASLSENARFFEEKACAVITELYNIDRDKALTLLVTKVNRYNSTPLEIAYSQKLTTFMAHTACQAKLNSIWYGDIALYTPSWRIGLAVSLPILIIQNLSFITIPKKDPCQPRIQAHKPKSNKPITSCQWIFYCIYMFYRAPVTKFTIFMVSYFAFLVIFALFVLTDLYPLSERPPSTLEYLSWMWTLSLLIEEIRQIVQTNRGSVEHNLQYWSKNIWNVFDMIMYFLFLVSVFLRCLLNSDQFYFARMAYAITLSMFILRSMHFFFVDRYIGPKVVMIGRMLSDLVFFIALFALFVFSFGIMYQAVLFPNSVLSPWELLKDLVYFPYWQLYGELNLERIEGTEPSECTNDYDLYINGTMERCAESNQFNSTMLAVYLILTNILLINLLIAMFSYTFERVQENSEMIWKFNMYALIYEYYDKPMFPIPVLVHLLRIIVFCYYKIGYPYESDFELLLTFEEMENLNIVEHFALQNCQNGPSRAGSRYNARNMMTDERDMNTEADSTPTQKDIKDLREYISEEIRRIALRQQIVLIDLPRR